MHYLATYDSEARRDWFEFFEAENEPPTPVPDLTVGTPGFLLPRPLRQSLALRVQLFLRPVELGFDACKLDSRHPLPLESDAPQKEAADGEDAHGI
jgi:hypothetical protein